MAFHSDPPKNAGTVSYYNGNWPAEMKATSMDEVKAFVDKLNKDRQTCPACDTKGLVDSHETDGCRMNGK